MKNGELRVSEHHIDGNHTNDDPKNRMKIPQSIHFVAHQVARHAQPFELPSVFFIGKAGTGKTTWANKLVDAHGYSRLSFASEVKRIAKDEFGMVTKDRKLLQIIGRTGRALDKFLWVKYLTRKLQGHVVIDDCRFLNEFLVLKLLGFTSVFLKCPDDVRIPRLTSQGGLNDISETELEQLEYYSDFVFDTSESKDLIYSAIALVLEEESDG